MAKVKATFADLGLLRSETSVKKWLNRLDEGWRKRALQILKVFMIWLEEGDSKFSDYTPDMLVQYQKEAGNGEAYDILDQIQAHVQGFNARYGTKLKYYSTLRAFFGHNRALLPSDPGFTVRGDKPKIQGKLAIEEIRDVVLKCNKCYRAVFLSMFQAGLDQDGFLYWNEHGWPDLKEALKGDPMIIKIEIAGRKRGKNVRPFYSFIGPDAIQAIQDWIKVRPEGAAAIFVNQFKIPIKKSGLFNLWKRKLQELGYVERSTSKGVRVWSGKGLHEIRDVFRTQWGMSSAKPSVAEYLMGHFARVDPLEYDKTYKNESFMRKEYEKALSMLQIMTSGRPFGQVDEDEVSKLNSQIQGLEAEVAHYKAEIDRLRREQGGFNERLERMSERLDRNSRLETKVVYGEESMVEMINEGWELMKEINGNRYIMRGTV